MNIFALLFGIAVLFVWYRSDKKKGSVKNLYLLLPFIPLPFINLGMSGMALIFFLLFFSLSRLFKNQFGFADVIALPFALFFALQFDMFSMCVFALALDSMTLSYPKLYPEIKRIIFIPIIFSAFMFGAVSYLVLAYQEIIIAAISTYSWLFGIAAITLLVNGAIKAGNWARKKKIARKIRQARQSNRSQSQNKK